MNRFKDYIPHAKDWEFIQRTVAGLPARLYPALFCAYLASWRHAALSEPVEHKRDNVGRRAANTRIRESAAGIRANDTRTLAIYTRLLESGPKQSCATCSKCTLEGVCSVSKEQAGELCQEWKADFTR